MSDECDYLGYLISENNLKVQEKEKREDIDELFWLHKECSKQVEILKQYNIIDCFNYNFIELYHSRLSDIDKKIKMYESNKELFDFRKFIELKYELRIVLKQVVGLHTSFNWQSPASSYDSNSLIECSLLQNNQFIYMRTHTSEELVRIEGMIAKEYYELLDSDEKYVGHLTNSGMKALEVAIVLQKMTCLNDYPVYFHEGTYFESKELINRLYTNPIQIDTENLYFKLDSNEKINCIIVDTGVNWPVKKSVNLDLLFEKISHHNQREPLFVILDSTLSSVSNHIFSKYVEKIPKNVIIVTVESMLKYFQMGMELTNLGFVVFYGDMLKRQLYKDIVFDLLRTLTAIPDDSLIKRLPDLRVDYLKSRLKRITRNSRYLMGYCDYLKERGLIESVVSSSSEDNNFYIDDEPWLGGQLYLRFNRIDSIEQYEDISKCFIYNEKYKANISYGMSFGFDTTRVCAIQDLKCDGSSGLCLRVSVGKESLSEIIELITKINEFIKDFSN